MTNNLSLLARTYRNVPAFTAIWTSICEQADAGFFACGVTLTPQTTDPLLWRCFASLGVRVSQETIADGTLFIAFDWMPRDEADQPLFDRTTFAAAHEQPGNN